MVPPQPPARSQEERKGPSSPCLSLFLHLHLIPHLAASRSMLSAHVSICGCFFFAGALRVTICVASFSLLSFLFVDRRRTSSSIVARQTNTRMNGRVLSMKHLPLFLDAPCFTAKGIHSITSQQSIKPTFARPTKGAPRSRALLARKTNRFGRATNLHSL